MEINDLNKGWNIPSVNAMTITLADVCPPIDLISALIMTLMKISSLH